MKKLICQSLVTCLAIVLFISCKKESTSKTTEEFVQHFSKEGLEYLQLNPGMYLIYKDSATGNTDSVIVAASLLETASSPAVTGPGYYRPATSWEVFTLILMEVNNSTSWFYGRADGNFPLPIYNSNNEANIILVSDAGFEAFLFYKEKPPEFFEGNITIEGINYTEVIKITGQNLFEETDPRFIKQTFYWAKGIGIIKWQKTRGTEKQTYTLIRHS